MIAAGLLLPAAASGFEIIEDETSEAAATDVAAIDAAVTADVLNAGPVDAESLEATAQDLYLAISINGLPRHVVVAVRREPDGSLWMMPPDLAEAGLSAPAGQPPDERVALASLTDVTYFFDEAQQSIDFTAGEGARARLIIDADGDDAPAETSVADADTRSGDFGVLVNYDLFAAASLEDGRGVVMAPLSGAFEARAFGPFGVVEQTFAMLSDPLEFRRLNTIWSFSDPGAMRTYRAGDIVTGALSWTRPTRLGGVQVQISGCDRTSSPILSRRSRAARRCHRRWTSMSTTPTGTLARSPKGHSKSSMCRC